MGGPIDEQTRTGASRPRADQTHDHTDQGGKPMRPAYLGLDLGTSSLKALIVDDAGTVLARAEAGYVTTVTEPGAAEQHPADWANALDRLLAAFPAEARARVTAVGLAGHVPTLVLVDAAGVPVRPAMTWQDSRATAQAKALEEALGDVAALVGTPLPWSPAQLPAKLRWVADRDPAAAAAARWILQPKDYLAWLLTGEFRTDGWSSKGVADVRSGAPITRILEATGFSAEHCPAATKPWEPAGQLTESAASRFGLPVGTPVATGWSDALAAVLAVGGFDRPSAFILGGTSDIVGVSAASVAEVEGVYSVPAAAAPLALSFGPTQGSGASLDWICGVLRLDRREALEAAAGASATGLPMFLPYLSGERAPVWNPAVRGMFLGLDSRHGSGELVRAVLRGVALSGRHVLERAATSTESGSTEIHVGGRGTDSALWQSTRLRALGKRLVVHAEPSLSALGAAMLGAMAVGVPLSGLGALRGETQTIEPGRDELTAAENEYSDYLAASAMAIEWSKR